MTRVSVEPTASLQSAPPRSKPARDDTRPRDDFSTMIDSGNARPPEPTRTTARDRSDRAQRAAHDRRDDDTKADDASSNVSIPDGNTPMAADISSKTSKVEVNKTDTKTDAKTTDVTTSDTTKPDSVKTSDAVAPATNAVIAAVVPGVVIVPQALALSVPQLVVPSAQTSTPTAATDRSGPLSIAAAALATSAATVDASVSQPTPTTAQQNGAATPPAELAAAIATPSAGEAPAALPAIVQQQGAATATKPSETVVADPALAVAVSATNGAKPAAKSAINGVDTTADATASDTKPTDAKTTDALGKDQSATTAAAAHATTAKGEPTAPKNDGALADTTSAPASHDRHASAPQTAATDVTTPTFTPVHQATQPTIPTPAAAPQFTVVASQTAPVPLNALAMQIAATASSGKTSFDIRLDPAELGRIDVRLDVDRHGNVTSHLTVEKPETLAMLKQDAPQLQRALNDAGLQTSDKGLQFSLSDQSLSGQNNQSSAQDSGGRPSQRLIVAEDDLPPVVMAGRSYGRLLTSSSGVDIRV